MLRCNNIVGNIVAHRIRTESVRNNANAH